VRRRTERAANARRTSGPHSGHSRRFRLQNRCSVLGGRTRSGVPERAPGPACE
jgi:hypothetical protein